ncbi:MAG: DnaJ domain-containing protein [Chloroflexi bacterium]|nr:DnaJ domain-containing protein [Chloroflexota bacterium]
MSTASYYKRLEIEPSASREQIDAAYRRLAARLHPDVNPAPDATARMQALNEAYRGLRDLRRREDGDPGEPPTGETTAAAPSAELSARDKAYLVALDALQPVWTSALVDWSRIWAFGLDALYADTDVASSDIVRGTESCGAALSAAQVQLGTAAPGERTVRLHAAARSLLDCQSLVARQAASFCKNRDPALLGPLASLSQRLAELATSVAAERLRLGHSPAQAPD